jgi:tetratricopeptide (TPR) repeat protein
MLQAGGIGNAFGDLANLESIFGIEDKKNNIRDSIRVKTINNTKIYSFNNNELVRVKYSKIKIPKEYLESFSKYLTYSTEIHPSIQEKIVKTKLVPDYIQYNYTNVAIKATKTYNLLESKKTQHTECNIYHKKRFLSQRDFSKMGGIIDLIMFYTMFNKSVPFDSTVYFNEAHKLSNEGKNLSGLLRLLEYLLSTGNQPTNQIREIVLKQKTDSLLASFLFCLNSPKSKEEAELKLSKLNTLINRDIKYGYVMNIFAANYIEPIDQSEAISYFYKALSNNQYITGAWLDLGKIYANRYQYDDAWKCFEIMLNIKSDHPMAQEIVEKQAYLKSNYPDYFKTN